MKVAGAINYGEVVIFKLSYYGGFLQLDRIVRHTIWIIKVNEVRLKSSRYRLSFKKTAKLPLKNLGNPRWEYNCP